MKNCHGLGHGSHTTDYTSYTTELQRTRILPLKSAKECEDALNNKFFLPNHSITWTAHASHLCAGGEEYSDTCEGDGGGPLVCAAVPETNEDEEISAGEGGAGTVDNSEPDEPDYSEPDPIFGEFKPDYDGSEDLDDDDVFGDSYEYPDEDTNVFESDNLYDDYPCDDSEDTLGLRESALCKKGARSSPGESGKVKTRLCPT